MKRVLQSAPVVFQKLSAFITQDKSPPRNPAFWQDDKGVAFIVPDNPDIHAGKRFDGVDKVISGAASICRALFEHRQAIGHITIKINLANRYDLLHWRPLEALIHVQKRLPVRYASLGLPQKINGLLLFSNPDQKPGGRRNLAGGRFKKIGRPAAYQQWKARIDGVFVSSTLGVSETLIRRKKKAVTQEKKCPASGGTIAVDTEGLPHAIHITTAGISDKAGALEMISLRESSLSHAVSVL